jgi:hypothetical protein
MIIFSEADSAATLYAPNRDHNYRRVAEWLITVYQSFLKKRPLQPARPAISPANHASEDILLNGSYRPEAASFVTNPIRRHGSQYIVMQDKPAISPVSHVGMVISQTVWFRIANAWNALQNRRNGVYRNMQMRRRSTIGGNITANGPNDGAPQIQKTKRAADKGSTAVRNWQESRRQDEAVLSSASCAANQERHSSITVTLATNFVDGYAAAAIGL